MVLYEWFKDIKCDIIFPQETHFTSDRESIYNSRGHGSSIHAFSTSAHSKGVSILIRRDFACKVLNQYKSADGRILVMNIEYENRVISLCNIYAPNDEKTKVDFFKKVSKWISMYFPKRLELSLRVVFAFPKAAYH